MKRRTNTRLTFAVSGYGKSAVIANMQMAKNNPHAVTKKSSNDRVQISAKHLGATSKL
jgi:hypothetical protein